MVKRKKKDQVFTESTMNDILQETEKQEFTKTKASIDQKNNKK